MRYRHAEIPLQIRLAANMHNAVSAIGHAVVQL
jgi:hypothetical protein